MVSSRMLMRLAASVTVRWCHEVSPQTIHVASAGRMKSDYTYAAMYEASYAAAVASRRERGNLWLTACDSPICIGPLVPEPALITGRNIRRALNELTKATQRTRRIKRYSLRRKLSCMSEELPDEDSNELEDTVDDILTLNTCGHAFHSRCLASWFLMDRFDCPMCRVAYYTRPSPPPQAFVVSSMYVGYRGGRVMGLG